MCFKIFLKIEERGFNNRLDMGNDGESTKDDSHISDLSN